MAVTNPLRSWFNLGNYILKTKLCCRKSCQCVVNLSSTFYRRPWTGKFHFHNVKLVFKMSLTLCLQSERINSLPKCLRLIAWLLTHERNKTKHLINESFRANGKLLTTNDNLLEIPLSAMTFRWHSCQVPCNFAQNIAARSKISSSRKQ